MAEVEVKAKIKDAQKLIQKLEALGCVLTEPIAQKDTNYIRNGLEYQNVNSDCIPVLRIREEKDRVKEDAINASFKYKP